MLTLLRLRYQPVEIIALLKSHPASMKTFIGVLFLDLVALSASHLSSCGNYHSALDKMGILLDTLLVIIPLLAIDQILGWLFFVVWSLVVVAMAYKLYKYYKQSLESLCASVLRRPPVSHSMMARHSSREVELQQKASHNPSEQELEAVSPRATNRPRVEEFNSAV